MPAGSLSGPSHRTTSLPSRRIRLRRYRTVTMRRRIRRVVSNAGNKQKQFMVSRAWQRGPNPFPREYYAKLHYNHWTGLACPGAGVAGGINFRLNSLFDPDQSGVGHQPYQFDQLTPIYGKSKVYGCLVELIWSDPNGDGYMGGYSVQGPNMTGPSGKSIDYIMELPNTKVGAINNTGSQVMRQRIYVDLAKLNGVSRETLMADPAYEENTAGAAIAKNNLLQVFAIDPTGGTPSCSVRIKLTYYCKLYGYKDPGQS